MNLTQIYFQCMIGLQCDKFAMLVTDQTQSQSIIVMKHDENKVLQITDTLVMGFNGDSGDALQFTQFIAKNMQLYKLKNGYDLDTGAAAHFTRKNMAECLRNGMPFLVNLMFGGYDAQEGGQLYTLDYLSSCMRVPYATHGFGGLLSHSIIDQFYTPTMSQSDAISMLKICFNEVKQRLFINLPKFQVVIVSKDGIHRIPNITPDDL